MYRECSPQYICVHSFVCYSADEAPLVHYSGPRSEVDELAAARSKGVSDNNDGDGKSVTGPTVLAYVYHAKTICK